MQTITRAEFEAMAPRLGGDLWNTYKLCEKAFLSEDVIAIKFERTTGLWCDVMLIFKDGTRSNRHLRDND